MGQQSRLTIVAPGFEIMTPEDWIRRMPKFLERCGRVCYKSEGRIGEGGAERFIRGIIRSGHESVIEHCSITVKIIGDRSMSHQLVRHRIGAYSQESQRYCDYGKLGFQVICPPSIANLPLGKYFRSQELVAERRPSYWIGPDYKGCGSDDKARWWLDSIWRAYQSYTALRRADVPPEDARSVLPNATKTEVVTTYNLRQWRHVFVERALNKHAQWQIRGILGAICQRFAKLLPAVFGDLAERLPSLEE